MWTLEEVAGMVGVDPQTIWRWENGVQRPRSYARRKLVEVFGLSAEELGLVQAPGGDDDTPILPGESTPDELQSELPSAQSPILRLTSEQAALLLSLLKTEENAVAHDPQKRRSLQQITRALGGLMASTPLSLLDNISILVGASASAAHDLALERFEKMITLCWRLLRGNELATVEYLLDTLLPETELLVQHPSPYQRRLAGFAAQAQIIKSLVLGHRDDLQAKGAACEVAIEYSRLAQRPDFEVTALIQQAVALDYRKQYERSFHIYQQAVTHADDISPLLRARVLAGLAGAYARNGQQEYEARTHLEQAREVMPARPETDPSYLYADSGPYTLPLWSGRVHFELDQYEQAFSVFSQVETQTGTPERIRTEFLNHMLETAIAQGDLDQSLWRLRQAGTAAVNLKSDRRQREVQEAGQMMLSIWRQNRQHIRETMAEVFAK